MHKRILEAVLIAMLTLTVTLILNASLNWIVASNGSIVFGPTIRTKEEYYHSVIIANHSSKAIGELRLACPLGVDIERIVASKPINISSKKENVGKGYSKTIAISNIEARSRTQILIPIERREEKDLIAALNAAESKLAILSFEDIQNPLVAILKRALIDSVIYSIFIGIGYFLVTGIERKRIEEFTTNAEKLDSEIKAIKGELKETLRLTHIRVARVRGILLKRANDYIKEIDFWRNVIKAQILNSKKGDIKDVNALFNIIVEKLGAAHKYRGDKTEYDKLYELFRAMDPDFESKDTI